MTSRIHLRAEELEPRDVPAAPFDTLPILPTDPAVLDHARVIALRGQALGRRADVFMKIGDSNTAAPGSLSPLGDPTFNAFTSGLAALRPDLLDTLNVYRTPIDAFGWNSFNRQSYSAFPRPTLREVMPKVPAELAATNAGIALILIGTNDVTRPHGPELFRMELSTLVRELVGGGVVPVLTTLPDMNGGFAVYEPRVPQFNQVIADVGEQFRVPVLNLWRATTGLPFQGIGDGLHLSTSPRGGGSFTSVDLLFGQNVRNLLDLATLDWFREQVIGAGPEFVPTFGNWTAVAAGQDVYAVGRGAGQQPVVSVYDRATGQELNRFLAYEPSFAGGVQVSMADVNGDRVPDIVTAPGFGGGPVVKVFSGADGSLIGDVLAFEPSFRTGVDVATADLDHDGAAEVIVGAGNGGGPAVAVFHGGDLKEVQRFFAFESSFRGGVTVAAANLAGFGPSIVVGSGVGGGPVVKVFRYGESDPATAFYVYDPAVRDGVNVAAGDLTGDRLGEIVTAPAAGSSHVQVIDPQSGSHVASFFASDPMAPGGVRLAVVGGRLLVGNGPGDEVLVRSYSGLSTTPEFLPPNDPGRAYGIDVG